MESRRSMERRILTMSKIIGMVEWRRCYNRVACWELELRLGLCTCTEQEWGKAQLVLPQPMCKVQIRITPSDWVQYCRRRTISASVR